MTKSTLLIALSAGLFASTAVFAQTPAPDASTTPGADSGMAASAPMKNHKKMSKMSSTGKNAAKTKTPDVTTGASAATMNGQSQ